LKSWFSEHLQKTAFTVRTADRKRWKGSFPALMVFPARAMARHGLCPPVALPARRRVAPVAKQPSAASLDLSRRFRESLPEKRVGVPPLASLYSSWTGTGRPPPVATIGSPKTIPPAATAPLSIPDPDPSVVTLHEPIPTFCRGSCQNH